MINLFSHRAIFKDTYLVTENYSPNHRVSMGVIVGGERILVIDTGMGLGGNVRKYIEGFVGKQMPMFCICTHGHSDCVGGVSLFDEAYLTSKDYETYTESFDKNVRLSQLEEITMGNETLVEFGTKMIIDNDKKVFKDLKDRDHFHLGGVHVEIFTIPGHTEGSIAVRMTREGVIKATFCGDALEPGMNQLTHMNRQALLDYRDALLDLGNKLEKGEQIYSTHSDRFMTPDDITDIGMACTEVVFGLTAGDPPVVLPTSKCEDSSQISDLRAHYVNNNYIVYNAELLK